MSSHCFVLIGCVMLNHIETNKVKKEHFFNKTNTVYTFLIKYSFSSIGQEKKKLQKQISKLLILTEMAASQK